MKIGIHFKENGFTPRWIEYCERMGIPYKLVDAYKTDIVEQLSDCDCFMWHYSQDDYRDALFAKQLISSLEQSGKRCFPNYQTGWHFDDKVAQKYLFESISAPLVPSYVFYTKKEALDWIKNQTFPKVFKLKGGAGAKNVRLCRTSRSAIKLVNRAFGKGFTQFSRIDYLKERFSKWRHGRDTLLGVCKGIGRLFVPTEFAKMHPREKGYVYFQDFIENNEYDIRVCIVSDKAFALKRLVRENDFRASGSGRIVYDKNQIDDRCVKMAFQVNDVIKMQSAAFDFVFDNEGNPMFVEVSYGYSVKAYDLCEGYWTSDLNWHPGDHFDFCGWMVESLIQEYGK